MNDTPIIDARELHVYYGASHILHDVSFFLRPGEAVGLMGRNGMGKTTLIRALLGHVKPRHGEVWMGIDRGRCPCNSQSPPAAAKMSRAQSRRARDTRL